MNGFPYFQFHADRWLTGKISAFDLDEQGFFLNLCLLAWASQGPFEICSTTVQRRFRKDGQWVCDTVEAFADIGVVVRDGEKYRIKFIDEQIELLSGKRQQRVDAGKASAAARKASSSSGKKSKQEKSKQEKSSTLNGCSTSVEREFDKFWTAYPRKIGKKAAEKAWAAAKDKPGIDAILAAVERHKKTHQWVKCGGEYIPNPSTWINQGRWSDESNESSSSKRYIPDIGERIRNQ